MTHDPLPDNGEHLDGDSLFAQVPGADGKVAIIGIGEDRQAGVGIDWVEEAGDRRIGTARRVAAEGS